MHKETKITSVKQEELNLIQETPPNLHVDLLYERSSADFGTLSSVSYYGAPQSYLLSLGYSGKCTMLSYVARILISHMKVSTQIYTS